MGGDWAPPPYLSQEGVAFVSHEYFLLSCRDQPLPTPEPQMPAMVPSYDLGMATDGSMQLSSDMV